MITIETVIPTQSSNNTPICSGFFKYMELEWSVKYVLQDGDLYASLNIRNYNDHPQITQWEATATVAYKIRRGSQTIIETEPNPIVKYFCEFDDNSQLAHRELVASKINLIDKFKGEETFLVEANIQDIRVRKPKEITLSELDLSKHEFLGGGGQASVFKAKYNGEFVAVKRYQVKSLDYMIEVGILLKVNHPNLLQMIGRSDEDSFIVFEYCPSTLSEKLHDPTFVLEWDVFTDWVNSLVKALHYLHQKNITHRDIKSNNVLLSRDNILRLGDFGFSKSGAISEMTFVTNHKAGTEGYMAPERKLNGPYTRKVDIYSFGVLVWEMATRKKVLPEWENKVLDQAHSQTSTKDVSDRKLPATLHTMISQCTNTDPALRPSSAELKDDEKGIWERALADIRMHRKEWPKKFNANGWEFEMNSSDNTNDATAIGSLQNLQISSDTVKKEPATTVKTPEVNVSCILNSSNEDLYTLVTTNADMCAALKQAQAGRFSKYVRLPPGKVHRFTYPKTETNPHFSLFRANGVPWREMNRIPIGRSIMCDGVDVFLTVVDDIWTAEKHM